MLYHKKKLCLISVVKCISSLIKCLQRQLTIYFQPGAVFIQMYYLAVFCPDLANLDNYCNLFIRIVYHLISMHTPACFLTHIHKMRIRHRNKCATKGLKLHREPFHVTLNSQFPIDTEIPGWRRSILGNQPPSWLRRRRSGCGHLDGQIDNIDWLINIQ